MASPLLPSASPIATFPTTNQPVVDTTLKDMLTTLHSSLHTDISSMLSAFKSEMIHVHNRMDRIEHQMSAMTVTVNDLVDVHDHTRDEHRWIRAKMVDLEDRSRRNNVKIRGILEAVVPADLNTYARKMISLLLPDLPLRHPNEGTLLPHQRYAHGQVQAFRPIACAIYKTTTICGHFPIHPPAKKAAPNHYSAIEQP